MKRIFALLLIAVLLSACGAQPTAAISDAEMQTKVAQILTSMPSATGGAPQVTTATAGLPTIQPTSTQPPAATNPAATNTAASTAAPAATQPPAATQASTATLAPTQPAPAATATPVPATATPTAAVTKAPTATLAAGDPRTTLGQPTWTDTMDTSDNWPTGPDPAGFTDIDFQKGALLLTGLKPADGWRIGVSDALTNFYLEETVNTAACTGKDRYGMIFRVPVKENPDQGYLAAFTCDGNYSFRKWDGPEKAMLALTVWKTNAAIKTGPNQVNRLGVMVEGTKMTLYANGVQLTSVSDPSYKTGFFGLFAGAITSTKYTVSVDEVDYWLR